MTTAAMFQVCYGGNPMDEDEFTEISITEEVEVQKEEDGEMSKKKRKMNEYYLVDKSKMEIETTTKMKTTKTDNHDKSGTWCGALCCRTTNEAGQVENIPVLPPYKVFLLFCIFFII